MDVSGILTFLTQQPLLALAMTAILVATVGGMLRGWSPIVGGLIRGVGNLGLLVALLLTIAQVARFTSGADFALPQIGLPEQSVVGGETRVPMSGDGHFWVRATVNGRPRRFLVDTGATLTAVSPETADVAGIKPMSLQESVVLRTANGPVRAELATIGELRFGSVMARDLDAVVAPGMGDTNVIGMNLLSRLASWRVEDNTLILVPRREQVARDITD